ncbi:MAG: LysR family transcriptional regulator [Cellvibrionales bacterium]|nr:LysR family transcriptional regulator [Cellvibrionales bacterium]
MNWDNIKVFLAVARGGSISNAGRELGVNHSTVLRRIQSLEDELNAQLFIREPRGYTLTKAGEQILDSAIMMDQDASALKRQIAAVDEKPSGDLKIAMPPGTCMNLMPIIADFKKMYPDINLLLDSQPSLHNLDKMEAEVAIRLSMEAPEHYMSHQLFEMPFKVYGNATYLEEIGTIERLSDVSWVCYDLPTIDISMSEWLKSQDPKTHVSVSVNTLALVKQSIESNLGISFLPIHVAEESPSLREVTEFGYSFDFPVYLIAHRVLYYQVRIKKFFEFIKQNIHRIQGVSKSVKAT